MKKIKVPTLKEIMYNTEIFELKRDIKKLRECFAVMLVIVSFIGLTILCITISLIN